MTVVTTMPNSLTKYAYDECALIFYCDNLHCCHNMNIIIDGTITLING